MKKFSMFFKRTLLVTLPAIFAGSLAITQLPKASASFADGEGALAEQHISNDIYTFNHIVDASGEHHVELLLSPHPRAYRKFKKSMISELKDAFVEILKEIVNTRITELSEGAKERTSVKINNDKPMVIEVGSSPVQLNLSVSPSWLPLEYHSDDLGCVTVSDTGLITPVGVGAANVSVSFAGNDEYNAARDGIIVNVVNPTPEPDPDPEPVDPEDEIEPKTEYTDYQLYTSPDVYADLIKGYCDYIPGSISKDLYQISSDQFAGFAYYYIAEQLDPVEEGGQGWVNTKESRLEVLYNLCALLAYDLKDDFSNFTKQQIFHQFYDSSTFICEDGYHPTLANVSSMLGIIKDDANVEYNVKRLLVCIGGDEIKGEIDTLIKGSTRSQLFEFLAYTPVSILNVVTSEINFTGEDLNEVVRTVGVGPFIEAIGQRNEDARDAGEDPNKGTNEIRDLIDNLPGFGEDAKNEFIKTVTEEASPRDVWSAINGIVIDGHELIKKNDEGLKKLQWNAVIDLIYPFIEKLNNHYYDNLEDALWRHEFDVELQTVVDSIQLYVTVGFMDDPSTPNDCRYLRKACKLFSNHVDFVRDPDTGHYDIAVHDTPGLLANMYRYLCEADFLTDEIKLEVWNVLFGTVDEAYTYLHQHTIDDLMRNAEQIDYKILAESIISADEVKAFFGTERFITQGRINKFIDKLFWAVNKGSTFDITRVYELVDQYIEISDSIKDKIDTIYSKAVKILKKIAEKNIDHNTIRDYLTDDLNGRVEAKIDSLLESAKFTKYYNKFSRLLEKGYARVPSRYKDKSIMDYYRGNGTWSGSGDVHFNIKKIVKRIPKVGKKAAELLESVDDLPDTISASFSFDATNIYEVVYHYGHGSNSQIKRGALPTDVDVPFFAPVKTTPSYDGEKIYPVVGWYTTEHTPSGAYTWANAMPAQDIEVYPIYFEYDGLDTIADEKVYERNTSYTISVHSNVNVETQIAGSSEYVSPFSFVWYKYDGQHPVSHQVGGDALTVKNAVDTGTYYCSVNGVAMDIFNVIINKRPIKVPTQSKDCPWSPESTYEGYLYTDTFDASDYNVGPNGEYILEAVGDGVDQKESVPGTYTTTIIIGNDYADNYYFEDYVTSYDYQWKIDKAKLTLTDNDINWVSGDSIQYDGQGHHWTINQIIPEIADKIEIHYDTRVAGESDYLAEDPVDVGAYVTHLTIELKEEYSAYYELDITADPSKFDKAFNITPLTIEYQPVLEENKFQYNESEIQVKLKDLPEQLEAKVVGNDSVDKATNVGKYSVTYQLEVKEGVDTTNFVFVPEDLLENKYTFKWEITPRVIDISQVTFDYNEFTYDGLEHSVRVTGLPSGVKVEYSGDIDATEVGEYNASARLYTDLNRYILKNGSTLYEEFTIPWKWVIKENEDKEPEQFRFNSVETNEAGDPLAWISLSKGIKGEYELHAEQVDPSKYNFSTLTQTGTVEVIIAYDINLYNKKTGDIEKLNVDANGNVIDANFKISINVLIPDEYKDVELVFAYVNADGDAVKLDSKVNNNYMSYTSNHLSIYGLVQTHVAGSNIVPYALAAGAALLSVQATASWILIMLAKRKRRNVKD